MRDQADLAKALETLSNALPREASSAAEQRVLAQFRALRRTRPRALAYVVSAAAGLLLSFGWYVSHRHPEQAAQARPDSSLAAAGFVVLPYGQNDVPLEQPVIVRVKIQSATGSINADLLVGQDGMARAFRLVE